MTLIITAATQAFKNGSFVVVITYNVYSEFC